MAILRHKIPAMAQQTEFEVQDKDPEKAAKEIKRLLESVHRNLEAFEGFPFTIQRLCELLVNVPPTQKTRLKYVRAIEKITAVTGEQDILVEASQLRSSSGKRKANMLPPTVPAPKKQASHVVINHHYHPLEEAAGDSKAKSGLNGGREVAQEGDGLHNGANSVKARSLSPPLVHNGHGGSGGGHEEEAASHPPAKSE